MSGIDFLKSGRQLTTNAGPFLGGKVVVLEDKGERCGVEKGCVLTEELGLAELSWLEGWWLSLGRLDLQAWEDVVNGRIGARGWAERESAG